MASRNADLNFEAEVLPLPASPHVDSSAYAKANNRSLSLQINRRPVDEISHSAVTCQSIHSQGGVFCWFLLARFGRVLRVDRKQVKRCVEELEILVVNVSVHSKEETVWSVTARSGVIWERE